MPATPVKVDVGLVGVVIDPPAPETIFQVPEPWVAVLPASVVEVPQIFWLGPAFAVVTPELTTTVWLAQVVVLHGPDANTK